MEYFSNTPFVNNLEDFEKSYKTKMLQSGFSEKTIKIFQDAYCIDLNPTWIKQCLDANNYIELFSKIITKCRILALQASKYCHDTWEEQLISLKEEYQVKLLKTLTAVIQEYCMEV